MPRGPLLLLPPSQGKATGGDLPPWSAGTHRLTSLDDARSLVLSRLPEGVAHSPTMPAIERYTGVLYKELAYSTLTPGTRRRIDNSVLIVSALWGLVSPRDPIPVYRLTMHANLPGMGRLSTWWRPRLTEALATVAAGRVVWDLLPNEHSAAWSPASVPVRRRITVRFVDRNGATVSHWNKLLKGSLVRFVTEAGLTDPRGLVEFAHPSGYLLDPAQSDLDGAMATVVLREQ